MMLSVNMSFDLGVGISLINHNTVAKEFFDSMGQTQCMNFLTWISANCKSSLLDMAMTNFPADVPVLPLPQLVHLIMHL